MRKTIQNDEEKEPRARIQSESCALGKPPKGCIHHSDCGSQYCSHEYQARLRKHGFKVSISGKGNCYDCEYGIAA